MRIAVRLLDRDQSTLGELFRQYAEAGEKAPRSMAQPSASDELVIDVETAIAELASHPEDEARSGGTVVKFRSRPEGNGSIKRFLAELDRLAPNEEQYAAQARAFAHGAECRAENKKK